MTEHILKVVPPYFDALLDGSKTFEVRKNDRAFQRGDRLVLWDFADSSPGGCRAYPCETCKPRAVTATVGFVFSGDPRRGMEGALGNGYVVLSLLDVQEAPR